MRELAMPGIGCLITILGIGCIANALMEKNIPVLMTSYPKLLNAPGGLYNSEKNKYLKSLNQYKLLIITTNLSLEELRNPADLEHRNIYDPIMEGCSPAAFSGKNHRTDGDRKNMENAAGILRDEPA